MHRIYSCISTLANHSLIFNNSYINVNLRNVTKVKIITEVVSVSFYRTLILFNTP